MLKTVLKLLRLRALVLIVLIAVIACLALGSIPEESVKEIGLVTLLLALWYLNGTSINDLADVAIDQINLKDAYGRPYANRKASKRKMVLIAAGSAVASLGVSVFLGWRVLLVSMLGLTLNYMYSLPPARISYRGIWALLLLPIGYVALPFTYTFLIVNKQADLWFWLLGASIYISFIGRMALKDYRDIRGDKVFGKRTFLIRYGNSRTVWFAMSAYLTGTLLGLFVFIRQNEVLLAGVLVLHAMFVFSLLEKIRHSVFGHYQQVLIGSVARIATTTLICMAIVFQSRLDSIVPFRNGDEFLVASLALFGVVTALYAVVSPKSTQVKY